MEGDDVNLTGEVTISNAGAQQEGETAGAAAHADEDMTDSGSSGIVRLGTGGTSDDATTETRSTSTEASDATGVAAPAQAPQTDAMQLQSATNGCVDNSAATTSTAGAQGAASASVTERALPRGWGLVCKRSR